MYIEVSISFPLIYLLNAGCILFPLLYLYIEESISFPLTSLFNAGSILFPLLNLSSVHCSNLSFATDLTVRFSKHSVPNALPVRCSMHSVPAGEHSAPPILATCSSPSPEQN